MKPLRVVTVGLNMGKGHLAAHHALPDYTIAAICDINETLAKETAEKYGNIPYYTDYAAMLSQEAPDVVCIATPNKLHCEMTQLAAAHKVKGIYCEKPIAINMAEAKIMREVVKQNNIPLVIGHQRRVSAPYRAMREAMVNGAIGEVYLCRGICAGDMLSDGTHTIDSLLFLNGDCDVAWVLGQVYRGPKASAEEQKQNRYAYRGVRFGHNVERGAMACFQLNNGVRCEIFSGDQMLMPQRFYQDIEIFGTKGRLWRNNDVSNPPVMINTNGNWEALPYEDSAAKDNSLVTAHQLLADTIQQGSANPLAVDVSMKGFEVLMSIYESARLNARIVPPLCQDAFPLDLMLDEGRFV